MDMYGISNAVMEENTLHGRAALEKAQREADLKIATGVFNQTIRDTKSRDTTANEKTEAENVSDIQNVIQTGKGLVRGAQGAYAGARDAVQTSVAAQRDAGAAEGVLASARDLNPMGITQSGEALSSESSLASGARTLGGALAGGARTTGAGLAGAGRGFISGADEAFGGTALRGITKSVAGGGEGLSGVEGIIQKGLVKAGGGEALGFVGAKAFGAAGGIMDAGGEINSLIKTDGKSGFTRVDSATGKRVKESGLDIAGELTTEAGSALDVASAFTGGLLVPFAAAVSLAGAGLSVAGGIEDEKSDDKSVGIKSDGSTDASKAPKLAAAPISQAFTSLGFVGNMSHNPIANIA
jgi:hypothetical protein